MRTLRLYVRLRRAYKRHGVTIKNRRQTWGDARFAVRIQRLP